MDREQFRAAAHSAIDDIVDYFDTVPERRVLPAVDPGYLRPLIPENPPADPEEWSQIQEDVDTKIKPGLTHWQSPNFMAYYPASVTYPSILGEMYSAAFTAPAFNWLCSPACTEMETIVMDWVAKALALPECFLSTSENRGGGVIQNSASDAIATIIVAARERRVRELVLAKGLKEATPEYENCKMEVQPRLVAIASDQTHSSAAKGALIAGTRFRSVTARLEDNMEMTGPRLREVLEQCDKDGLVPYHLSLTMGTTNTCSVDRFADIKAVLQEKPEWQRIWVHVDAAYAGAALVADEWQYIAKDFAEGVDSFNMNMHKWLLVNFDASVLYVRNRFDLTNALDITPTYLRNPYSDMGTVIDYRNWSISLGRRFRALKIWFVMRSYGLNGMKAHIRKGIDLGNLFTELVRSRSDLFEIVTKTSFCLTVLRVKNPQSPSNGANGSSDGVSLCKPDEVADGLTKKVYELINSRGEIFITSTIVDGVYVIRVVSSNPLAEEKYVRNAFDILVRTTIEDMSPQRLNCILVTGATGFIGAHVVDNLLARGFSVRGATRSSQKGEQMKAARPQYASKLDFVVVEDFTAIGVFDRVMEGIDAVIHVASPFFYDTTNNEEELILPAINGVKSILSASAKPGSKVQRIVMTSSFASVVDVNSNPPPDFTYTAAHWNPLTYEEAVDPVSSSVVAYRGSKKFAELAAWDFIKDQKPQFDLVALCPPMVFGPVVHPVSKLEQLNESNSVLWSVAAGADPLPGARVPAWIDARDLAEAHVQALITPEAGGKRYIPVSPNPFSYELAADIIRAEFEWAEDTVTRNYTAGEKPRASYGVDGETVARELGVKYRPFKEAVVGLIGQVHQTLV
ncbi:3-beta hydroxysteroid dehydrogenase/isomerase [Penicillium alfredii]|uniref:3-beta hydroxysteroid dehydrogenase/isomerase n=1 Tax=Penicillium alfredii TaxID=1506179 RepID=A0A9W9FJL5_9EURO|nr:3-beta hydroxysteroid dehydrogenase/isomerase [Penicillium alfredii]KAJ5101409.1 3-beta hydroxysteroid dehydrogenase/isomerase [Penicillium alfredii]